MPRSPTIVLYVAGWMYSGTTLLGRALGELDGVFMGGEIKRLWGEALARNEPCGCGTPVADCAIWSEVLQRAFGGSERVDAARLAAIEQRLTLHRRLPHLLAAAAGGPEADVLEDYRSHLARLYDAIRDATGCSVIVDTSKSPLYGLVLRGTPGLEVRVVHVVRDPRGTLFSLLRRREGIAPTTLLLLWTYSHAVVELGWHGKSYLRLRYEDLIRSAADSLDAVARHVGLAGARLPLLAPRRVALGVSHTIDGNRGRFATGTFELRPDDEWRNRLAPSGRLAATMLTLPLLLRHGYPLWPGRLAPPDGPRDSGAPRKTPLR